MVYVWKQKTNKQEPFESSSFTRFSVEGQNQFERGKIKERIGTGSFATLADSTMGKED